MSDTKWENFAAGDLVEVWVKPNDSSTKYSFRIEEYGMKNTPITEGWVLQSFKILGFQDSTALTLDVDDSHVEGWAIYLSDPFTDKYLGVRLPKEKLENKRGWSIGDMGAIINHIPGRIVVPVHRDIGGMSCSNCKEFIFYAEGNQPDGSLVCFSCRQDPARCRF